MTARTSFAVAPATSMSRRAFLGLAAGAVFALMGAAAPVRDALANAGATGPNSYTYTVSVAKGYLALRTAPDYDSANEIGALYSGDTVKVCDTSDSTYWYVYAPRLNASGYVNRNYLMGGEQVCPTYVVSVAKGYLALRTAPDYDSANEIGPLDSGDTVQVRSTGYGDYWYVYAPRYQCSGYVNANYLHEMGSYAGAGVYTVHVSKGYLALRTEMSYDSANEIGALYNGETVYLQSTTGTKYSYVYAPSLGCYGYVNADYLW